MRHLRPSIFTIHPQYVMFYCKKDYELPMDVTVSHKKKLYKAVNMNNKNKMAVKHH